MRDLLKRREQGKRWRLANPEKAKRFRLANPGYSVRWSQENWALEMVYQALRCDKKNKRIIDGPFVTEAFLRTMFQTLQGRCVYCSCLMRCGVGVNRRTDKDAATIQRMSNALGHVESNCTLCCMECNQLTSRSLPHDVMLLHGRELKAGTLKWCPYPQHAGSRVLPNTAFGVSKKRARGRRAYCQLCRRI